MNERIKQVLEIEKKAKEMQEKAARDAQELPVKAEQEGQALIAKAKADAEQEARKIIAAAQSVDAMQGAAADGDKSDQLEAMAKKNFDKAVAYVLDRVIGKA